MPSYLPPQLKRTRQWRSFSSWEEGRAAEWLVEAADMWGRLRIDDVALADIAAQADVPDSAVDAVIAQLTVGRRPLLILYDTPSGPCAIIAGWDSWCSETHLRNRSAPEVPEPPHGVWVAAGCRCKYRNNRTDEPKEGHPGWYPTDDADSGGQCPPSSDDAGPGRTPPDTSDAAGLDQGRAGESRGDQGRGDPPSLRSGGRRRARAPEGPDGDFDPADLRGPPVDDGVFLDPETVFAELAPEAATQLRALVDLVVERKRTDQLAGRVTPRAVLTVELRQVLELARGQPEAFAAKCAELLASEFRFGKCRPAQLAGVTRWLREACAGWSPLDEQRGPPAPAFVTAEDEAKRRAEEGSGWV